MSRAAFTSVTPLKRAVQLKGRVYGHIEDIPVFSAFEDRQEVVRLGVHGLTQAGIYGDAERGAFSICISGGYEDDRDDGDQILYVGSGGQDDDGNQVRDQSFEDPPNKSLLVSCHAQLPVRVVRGKHRGNPYAPSKGYRYDGLYLVNNAKLEKGIDGYLMCFYELNRIQEPGVGPIPKRYER